MRKLWASTYVGWPLSAGPCEPSKQVWTIGREMEVYRIDALKYSANDWRLHHLQDIVLNVLGDAGERHLSEQFVFWGGGWGSIFILRP